ncbi:Meiotically up-regulated gene 70 protein [Neolecta irregularis DAH-3]|uniref:Meiotically up-regulated gene 70 protein n=1 Tax=Neolecta irregularis (strain DAH-3) TaxID=1198029 RepID=A0A1U7LJV6_NEOID|nr:Meiotically up-regulated gene 70 protein [Neolecta irregularis DAH-3]|eukprot:OLL22832.1 Meiotically up-regulated gene 70 protein [Neolecta irregularis DAH-3]
MNISEPEPKRWMRKRASRADGKRLLKSLTSSKHQHSPPSKRMSTVSYQKRKPQQPLPNSSSQIPVREGTASFPTTPDVSDQRKRQSKKDEAIRRRLEGELNKKRGTPNTRTRSHKKHAAGTVMALRPSPPLTIKPDLTVAEASQIMAARREDCVLVIDDESHLTGIFTAKDLAFRVVGAGIDARDVTIAQIMTPNPMCARQSTSATEALDLMVKRGFRHLPVCDEDGDVLGVLDITKCFYEAMEKLERAYASSRKLHDALEGVQSEWGSSQQPIQIMQYVDALKQKMSGPDLSTVLDGSMPTMVSVRTSVREAAALMKENHTTAVLVMDQNSIAGIFTSKDVVLRVIAPGLDPGNCSVVRVMTPHPDIAPLDLSISAALRKMNDGHYLNLPVMDHNKEVIGIVDVLKLTYATLEQINSIQANDGEGPMWNKFWNSLGDGDTESALSDGQSAAHRAASELAAGRASSPLISPIPQLQDTAMGQSVYPNDSASHYHPDDGSNLEISQELPFAFKFKSPKGKVHRLQFNVRDGLNGLRSVISEKLGHEIEEVGGHSVFAVSYTDDEGDIVAIESDHDFTFAVDLARRLGQQKIDLFIHHPSKEVQSTSVASQSAVAVVSSTPTAELGDLPQTESTATKKSEERLPPIVQPTQQIPGIPNELLLPGAVITLAIAVVGVAIISFARRSK